MTVTVPTTTPVAGSWEIDTVHSYASFKVTHHVVATFRSGFHGVSGKLQDGTLSGSVPVENIALRGVDAFREHLLGPDWFDAAAHPELTFTSTEFQVDGDGSLQATGELTIKGITKQLSISGSARGPAEITRSNGSLSERLGLDLTAVVDRRDFGLNAGGGADSAVTLEVALELVKP